MLTAVTYGCVASAGLLLGAVIGLLTAPPRRLVAAVMAFGSGVLVSALTFDLVEEALATGSTAYVMAGFLLGAVVYVLLTALLDRLAARSPTREGRHPRDVEPGAAGRPASPDAMAISGAALLLGAVLDGIPENAALGLSVRAKGDGLGLLLLAAVFLGNLPESISGAVGMRQEGRSRGYVLGVWGGAALACTLAAAAGYALLGGLAADLVGAVLALAAGGILAMLADTMMPEAFEHGGPVVALATAVGFLCAIGLARLAT